MSGPGAAALGLLILRTSEGKGPWSLLNHILPSPFMPSLCCALRGLQVLGVLGFAEDERHRRAIPTVTNGPAPRAAPEELTALSHHSSPALSQRLTLQRLSYKGTSFSWEPRTCPSLLANLPATLLCALQLLPGASCPLWLSEQAPPTSKALWPALLVSLQVYGTRSKASLL